MTSLFKMAPSTNVVAKKTAKKISSSKNRKKGWKRHSNVADIEEHLEDRRKEEISGGPVSEKANEVLFYIESKPAKNARITNAQRKLNRQNVLQNLRCFRGLENESKVEPPVKPPNANQRFKIRTKPLHPRKLAKLVKREQIITANRMKMIEEKERIREMHLETGTYDLWDPQDAPLDKKPETTIGDEKLDDYYKEQIRRKSFKVPINRCLKPSALPAVEVPHPGASYNPSYDDHQQLLRQAVNAEEKKLRDKRRIRRVLTDFFPRVSKASNEEAWLQEMSQGLIDDGLSNNEVELVDCSLPLSLNPAVRAENRKSAKKRRRQARHEKLLDAIKKRKALVKKENQVATIGLLKTVIDKQTALYAQRKKQKKLKRLQKASQPSRLSKHKYKAPNLEVNLSEELSGSFRLLMMDGSLLNDRYKSLQRRNIIETRSSQKVKQKKLKLKTYTRKGFAERDIDVKPTD